MANVSPGEQLEELWRELLRALQPITVGLTTRKLNRALIKQSVVSMRKVLDEMERKFCR
jgi:hypothetical protein